MNFETRGSLSLITLIHPQFRYPDGARLCKIILSSFLGICSQRAFMASPKSGCTICSHFPCFSFSCITPATQVSAVVVPPPAPSVDHNHCLGRCAPPPGCVGLTSLSRALRRDELCQSGTLLSSPALLVTQEDIRAQVALVKPEVKQEDGDSMDAKVRPSWYTQTVSIMGLQCVTCDEIRVERNYGISPETRAIFTTSLVYDTGARSSTGVSRSWGCAVLSVPLQRSGS